MSEETDNPAFYANQLSQQRDLIDELDKDISNEEGRKIEIYKELNSIQVKTDQLVENITKMTNRKESLDTLIREIAKGFDKIQASTHSLYLLASRQLKMLKRKYPLNP